MQKIEDVYAKALTLSVNVEGNFFELARYLRQLLDRDPELFKKLVDKSEIGTRKAYYLANIARTFDSLRVNRARLKRIGWTKLQIIGATITPDNAEEMLGLAEINTASKLKAIVRGETPIANAHCVLMYFTPEQYEILQDVLVRHGATIHRRGMNEKEAALIRALERVPKTAPKSA